MIKLIQSVVEIEGNTQVSLSFIFALIAVVGTIYNIVSSSKKTNREEMEGIIKANMKLDQLCSNLNATSLDIREIKGTIAEMREIQVKHEIRITNLEKEKAEGD